MTEPSHLSRHAARRHFLTFAIAGLAGSAVAADPDTDDDAGPSRQGLYPGQAPSADSGYSPGVAAQGQRIVFVSGQGPEDRTADIETQMRQTFDRIGLVLQEAGASFEDVVMLRSYFVHLLRDLPILRKVRKDYLISPYPASTAVGVTELAFPDLMIEIEAIAIL